MGVAARRYRLGAVAATRVLVGTSMLARPALLPRVLGVDAATAARVSWISVMLGAREVALGAGTLRALRRGGVTPWVVGSALSDVADAFALGSATVRGHVRPVLGALAAASAGGTAAVQLALVLEQPVA